MRKPTLNLWISKSLLDHVISEANSFFPKETGGSLMGYIAHEQPIIVVTEIVNAGPRAKHTDNSFVPDYAYQEAQIAGIYKQSDRLHSYLGDWHSHPGGGTSPSSKDQDTMKNIATHARARAPQPIMVILGGTPKGWKIKFWQLQAKKIFGFTTGSNLVELQRTE